MYLLAHLLPAMRGMKNAAIWVNASLAAYRGLPKAAAYSASKAAVLSLVESLHVEARTWGIKLGVINHGFVRTRLTKKNNFTMPGLIEPDEAAARIVKGMKLKKFEISFPFGFAWWMKFLRCLPYGLYFSLTRRMV
jgi:short-subunit dehydrogenase